MSTNYIGKPVSRVDGRAKVTGQAKYAGEYNVPNPLYGFVVSSVIAKGRIARIDTAEALRLDGVRHVFTHMNVPHLKATDDSFRDDVAPPGSPFRPLQDDVIRFNGQPIALVVAETFELARYAASLVRVEYDAETHETNLKEKQNDARPPQPREFLAPPTSRGDFRTAFARAPVQLEAEYAAPAEHH